MKKNKNTHNLSITLSHTDFCQLEELCASGNRSKSNAIAWLLVQEGKRIKEQENTPDSFFHNLKYRVPETVSFMKYAFNRGICFSRINESVSYSEDYGRDFIYQVAIGEKNETKIMITVTSPKTNNREGTNIISFPTKDATA